MPDWTDPIAFSMRLREVGRGGFPEQDAAARTGLRLAGNMANRVSGRLAESLVQFVPGPARAAERIRALGLGQARARNAPSATGSTRKSTGSKTLRKGTAEAPGGVTRSSCRFAL